MERSMEHRIKLSEILFEESIDIINTTTITELEEETKNSEYEKKVKLMTDHLDHCFLIIREKNNYIKPISELLINKKDLYIVNNAHGSINTTSIKENPYKTFTIPDGLFFYYLKKVPYGVCNISTREQSEEILDILKMYITKGYFMNEKLKRNAQKIEYVLLNMQKTLYRINQDHLYKGYKGYNEGTNTFYNIETDPKYSTYKKYSHITPDINVYKDGNKIINKMFSVYVEIINGKIVIKNNMFIVDNPRTHIGKDYDLFTYIRPEKIVYKKNKKWIVYYMLDDIIKYLVSKKIHSCIFIDLSCSANLLTNNVNSLIHTASQVQNKTYNVFNRLKKVTKTRRNKNTQFSPPKKSKSFFGW